MGVVRTKADIVRELKKAKFAHDALEAELYRLDSESFRIDGITIWFPGEQCRAILDAASPRKGQSAEAVLRGLLFGSCMDYLRTPKAESKGVE